MRNRYNFYHDMLRAAAGDPPSGGADDDDAGDTANAKAVNADDVEDQTGNDTVQAAGGEDTLVAGGGSDTLQAAGDDTLEAGGAKPPIRMVPRDAILRRVGDLTKDKTKLTGEVERLRLENETLKAGTKDPAAVDPPVPDRAEFKTKAEFDAAVEAVAEKKTQQRIADQQFTSRCNAVADVGEVEFKADWNESVANLRMLGDDGNIPKLLLDAALESDNPAQALHHLGQHPDEAMEILALTPIQQVARVTKLGTKKAVVPKPRTKAPDPIEPLDGNGGAGDSTGLTDDVDDETWLRNRNAQINTNRLAAVKR